MKRLTYKISFLIITVLLIIATAFSGWATLPTFAETDTVAKYESSNVWNDLQGATLGDKAFNVADYPHIETANPQVISFVEFCYSYYAKKQTEYGLYVYVYNPQDKAFDTATDRNKIQFTYGDKSAYSKYSLQFLNYSKATGYEGRFYKFKVKLTDTDKANILREVKQDKRVYKISGIELSYKNDVAEYLCAQTYTYSGFAEGYGSELATSDTLSCVVDGFEKYLCLDVKNTFFRGRGTNGKKYIQDTLHSVYFSVPNKIIAEYGNMSAVHATWLNAYTAPALVTGNKTHYDTMLEHIGENIGVPETYSDLSFKYSFRTEEDLVNMSIGGVRFSGYYYGYNYPSKLSSKISNNITSLNWLFYASNGDADTYDVPSEDILDYMAKYSAEHSGAKINGRYSKDLFEKVDAKFTDINIRADEKYSLTSEIISRNFWEKLFGGSHVEEVEEFNNIKAIEAVNYDDVNKLNSSALCTKYYIDDSDCEEFKGYCQTAKRKNETVYLFRYKQSEYFSAEVYEGTWKSKWVFNTGGVAISPGYVYMYENDDTNAYVMQQWVQLDFDIIDLTFTKDGVDTVIPVIMSPQDIVADGDHPVVTTSDKSIKWWQLLLGLVGLLLILFLLIKFLPQIISWLLNLIVVPLNNLKRQRRKNKKQRIKDDKARQQVDKEFDKFHKENAKKQKQTQRQARKVNVEKLKRDIWSEKRSELDLNDAERYALSQDEEWQTVQDELTMLMYGGYDGYEDF